MGRPAPRRHETLPHHRQGIARARTQDRSIGGHRPPTQKREIKFCNGRTERIQSRIFLATLKKHHADAKLVRQFDPANPSGLPEESLRKRDQQARAISTAAIRVHAAAMGQARQGLQPAFDHGVRRRSAQLGDEANAACIMIRRKGEATLRHTTCLT